MNIRIKQILVTLLCVIGFASVLTYAEVTITNNGLSYRINNNGLQGEYFAITGGNPTKCYGILYDGPNPSLEGDSDLFVSKNTPAAWDSFITRAYSGLVRGVTDINSGVGSCGHWTGSYDDNYPCVFGESMYQVNICYGPNTRLRSWTCRGVCGDEQCSEGENDPSC